MLTGHDNSRVVAFIALAEHCRIALWVGCCVSEAKEVVIVVGGSVDAKE